MLQHNIIHVHRYTSFKCNVQNKQHITLTGVLLQYIIIIIVFLFFLNQLHNNTIFSILRISYKIKSKDPRYFIVIVLKF